MSPMRLPLLLLHGIEEPVVVRVFFGVFWIAVLLEHLFYFVNFSCR